MNPDYFNQLAGEKDPIHERMKINKQYEQNLKKAEQARLVAAASRKRAKRARISMVLCWVIGLVLLIATIVACSYLQ